MLQIHSKGVRAQHSIHSLTEMILALKYWRTSPGIGVNDSAKCLQWQWECTWAVGSMPGSEITQGQRCIFWASWIPWCFPRHPLDYPTAFPPWRNLEHEPVPTTVCLMQHKSVTPEILFWPEIGSLSTPQTNPPPGGRGVFNFAPRGHITHLLMFPHMWSPKVLSQPPHHGNISQQELSRIPGS